VRRRSRAPHLLLLLALFAVLATVGFASAAQAQSNTFLLIRKADSADPSNVKLDFVYTGNQGDLSGLKLTQNGSDKTTKGAPVAVPGDKAIVFVIDSGPGMDQNGALVNARKGAVDVVNAAPASTRFAVVQAGDRADLKTDLTTDKAAVIDAIDGSSSKGAGGIGPTQGSAVWSALRIAGGVLQAAPNLQPNVILSVADNDNVSPKEEPVGKSSVTNAGATVWAVQKQGAMDPTPYNAFVAVAGGQVLSTDDAVQMAPLTTQAGTTIGSQQYQLTYDSGLQRQDVAETSISVNGATSGASFIVGGVYQGNLALRPNVVTPAGSASLFGSKMFFLIALVLALLGAVGIAYALTTLFVKDDLSNVLQPYADPYGDAADDEASGALGNSAIMARAVQLTEQVAESQGMLTRAEGALERANLPLRAGEALFVYVVIVLLVTLFGLFLTRNMVGGIVCGVIGALLPISVVNYLAKKRRKKFMSQLPDTLSLLSGTLKAGYSLMQGVEAVSQEVSDPMGIELRRVVTEARLGRPLEEALEASADRMDSPDFAWAVMAIRIQREVGGNLAELLMTVADTMIARERLRRDVSALTAEGRVSAIVLGALPAGLGVLMYVLNPEYTGVLFTDSVGIGMLITAIVSMLIGFLWMRKIINIEI